jgi:predicted esterase
MRSRSWLRKFALACAISAAATRAQTPVPASAPAPAIALIDAADAPQWEPLVKQTGWQLLTPAAATNIDQRVQALASTVRDALAKHSVDPTRIYLAGRGEASAAVFYTISRVPDLWAAGVALGGSPAPAIDSDRIYAANFKNVPVLWIGAADADKAAAEKWKAAGLPLEFQAAAGYNNAAMFEWLAKHRRADPVLEIDCETNSPSFASCYWIQMTKFDPGERNDVLDSTRIPAPSHAALDLGAFSYKVDDPGPGVLVSALPPKYDGPLKVNDRLMQLDGHPIASAQALIDTLAAVKEEKPAVVTVQRGAKDRVRIETKILLPSRQAVVTARVQGRYQPEDKEIQIVSRTVKEMRVVVPDAWNGSQLNWNGLSMETPASGCVLLTIEKELMHAAPCS